MTTITIEVPDGTSLYGVAGILEVEANVTLTPAGYVAKSRSVREEKRKLELGKIHYKYTDEFQALLKSIAAQIYDQAARVKAEVPA